MSTVSLNTITRVLNNSTLNLHLAIKHNSSFGAFLNRIRGFLWNTHERDTNRLNFATNFAKKIRDIPENTPTTEKAPLIYNDKNVMVLIELRPDKSYEIRAYKAGLFSPTYEVLAKYKNEEEYKNGIKELKQSAMDYLNQKTDLFGPRTISSTDEQTPKPWPDSKLVCIIGGTGAKATQLKSAYQLTENNSNNILCFDGCNILGTNMQDQVKKINKDLRDSLANTTIENSEETVVTLYSHSRGCFAALQVARENPQLKFRLVLSAPTKGPIKNDLLKSNLIPKNVVMCILDYPKIELTSIAGHSILHTQSTKTKLSVRLVNSATHNNQPLYDIDLLKTFQIEKNERTMYLGEYNNIRARPFSNQNLIESSFVTPDNINKNANTIFANGHYYNLINGKKDGDGQYIYTTGDKYKGQFKDDMMHGNGLLSFTNGDTYIGNFENNEINNGILKFANRNIYEGQFKDYMMHGDGQLSFTNGDTYIGNFENNEINNGILKFANRNIYEGQFKDYMMHGDGQLSFTNGDTYQGQFENGMMHGFGIQICANGDAYIGNFEHGKFIEGTQKFANGDIYEGQFEDYKGHGIGSYASKDGYMYYGNFKDGKFIDGVIIHQNNQNKVTVIFPNGDKYQGPLKNGKMHGTGQLIFANGDKYQGQFENNMMHGDGWYIDAQKAGSGSTCRYEFNNRIT